MSYQQGSFFQKCWEKWEKLKLYQAGKKEKISKEYILVEFPYPSGSGLHIGHAFCFTGADVYTRFKRMFFSEKDILFPMGWDAFGLPAENYAIKNKRKPQEITNENTIFYKKQMKELGFSFDWEREINTTDPNYYKWTQWIFIQLFKKGLAYKKEMPINWCPSCKIGLANEEVIDNKCERCGAETNRRNLNQWVVKITDYADKLIKGLDNTNFIEKVKLAQINWIGESQGAKVFFKIANQEEFLEIFTTRPDTLWGATFMVIAPEHPLVNNILTDSSIEESKKSQIKEYLNQAKKKSDLERTELNKEKTGVFTGLFAINPVNQKKIPIWISDFVLISYGTGAIMAVPAHDERDWAFAKKFDLEIIPVIKPPCDWDFNQKAYLNVEEGKIVNSEPINGMAPNQAFEKVIKWLEKNKIGKKTKNYHLRDWIFSRQHYWGEPIPMIHCEKCGWHPVNENDLPVELPIVEHYEPTETGESPLSKMTEWVKTVCPKCGGEAERETDTMPNWAGSDWYFLRYLDPNNSQALASEKQMEKWLPVDLYIGGDEHNTLHLLYSRFIYQFLWEIGVVPKKYLEPYQKRISHGVILGPDNQKMSKSKGNVIIPEQVIKRFEKWGADILRIYLMFIGPFDGTMAWNDNALMGVKKFLDKIEDHIDQWISLEVKYPEVNHNNHIKPILHKTIKGVTQDLESLKFNTAVAKLMKFINEIRQEEKSESGKLTPLSYGTVAGGNLYKEDLEKFLILLSPFAPFFCEAQWEKLNPDDNEKSIFQEIWPKFDEVLAQEKEIDLIIQINGKVRDRIKTAFDILETEAKEKALAREKIKAYLLGKEPKKIIFVKGKLVNIVL